MKQIEIVRIKEQIQNKIEKGDYITLGKMLGTSQDTARMRFRRNNEESVLAIQSIIDNRDSLIESYKEK